MAAGTRGRLSGAFGEKWKDLPRWPAIVAGCGKFLPGADRIPAKFAGTVFPRPRKIDA
jgi:hypothetical protein